MKAGKRMCGKQLMSRIIAWIWALIVVRHGSGAYCAMTIISLLDLPLELPSDVAESLGGMHSFIGELPNYLSRCKTCLWLVLLYLMLTSLFLGQTFEGGISGSPGVEAHGAYAFCALACLSIIGSPEETIPRYEASRRSARTSILTMAKAYESPPTPVMAICSTVRPRGRLLWENE